MSNLRLLERKPDRTFHLSSFAGKQPPEYAILSHTWHTDNTREVSLIDIENGTGSSKAAWEKLHFCADRCALDGLHWFWVDTCCIDKRDAVETSAAINSMFRWYKNATRCYVYLTDVSAGAEDQGTKDGQSSPSWELAFRKSRWHTRSWTLQELIAPSSVEFYSLDGERLGSKDSLRTILVEISGISEEALSGRALSSFSIRERESWAEHRETTIEEDLVYSLLGIFDVTMPLIYGEGKDRARRRLHREISTLPDGQTSKPSFHLPFNRNTHFTGRNAELEVLKRRLLMRKECSTLALVGLGGVGKTQIALKLAHTVKEEWPEYSIYWLSALSMETFKQSCGEVVKKLQLPESAEEEQMDMRRIVKQELSNESRGRWLLIVDNADSSDLLLGTQHSDGIIEYLPTSEHGLTVFTSRNHAAVQVIVHADVVHVDKMEEEEALEYMQRSVSRQALVDNVTATKELLIELDFLPLAISQAAAYMDTKHTPVVDYLKRMRNAEQGLVQLMSHQLRDNTRNIRAATAVATTWITSFEEVLRNDKDAADILEFIACIEWKSIPHSILPLARSGTRLASAIGTLSSYSFVTKRNGEQQYDMHRLVHLATRIWLDRESRSVAVKGKAIAHLEGIWPSPNWDNREVWRAYLPHVEWVRHFVIVSEAKGRLRTRLQRWLRKARDVDPKNADANNKSRLCLRIGQCLRTDGRIKESFQWSQDSYQWAIGLSKHNEYRLHVEHTLATDFYANGLVKEAVELLERVVTMEIKVLGGKHPNLLASQIELAGAYLASRQVKKAIELLERVVAIQAETLAKNHTDRLAAEHELARAYLENRQVREATKLLEGVVAIEAVELAEEHPSRLLSEDGLAFMYALEGRMEEAVQIMISVVRRYQSSMTADRPERVEAEETLDELLEHREDPNSASWFRNKYGY